MTSILIRAHSTAGLESTDIIAAVGTDGVRAVVWGLGNTEEAAEADARNQDTGGMPLGELRFVAIDADRAARIEAGDLSAEDLWNV